MSTESTQPRTVTVPVSQAPLSPRSTRASTAVHDSPWSYGAYNPDDTNRASGGYNNNRAPPDDHRFPAQQEPQDPLRHSMAQQQQQSASPSYRHDDPRTGGYQPTSPMQAPTSPSLDYSQAPMSPLPPYIARPPPAMAPPQYYQEIHQETQAPDQMGPMGTDDRIGHGYAAGDASVWGPGGTGRSSRQDEEMLYRSAGQFNPNKRSGYGEEDPKQGECCSFLRDIAEFCPCFCLCCVCFSALN
ncbi:hypothetical protein BC939DRAFT_468570 [Gamsiella multidivaricata]|uniref:uncharacterized protein n=1 Tax=Gamsiella multidivaricata TaxID=101098 RepID=UPI00221FEB87|nr:uncharacterized protein BC939DRAFT_468570 [Gamsiella multidivaricata]KAI7816601.1 hypothetical protein BC939DRAFT_468570 [Gamsiella multidivaricata]